MTPRNRQWLAAGVALVSVLAVLTAWSGYLRARSTPHYVQSAPGEPAVAAPDGGMEMRLASLTVTQQLLTDRQANPAPGNALWVIAVVDYVPLPESGSCSLALRAVDGRMWSSLSPLDYEGSRSLPSSCSAKTSEGTPRFELIYQIPQDAAGSLAGLVSSSSGYRGTQPYPVLTPPE